MDTQSVQAQGINGEEGFLSCGCAPLGSKSRKRCAEALALNDEINRLQERVMQVPAGTERMAVMGEKAAAYDAYRVHLGARAVSNHTGLGRAS